MREEAAKSETFGRETGWLKFRGGLLNLGAERTVD